MSCYIYSWHTTTLNDACVVYAFVLDANDRQFRLHFDFQPWCYLHNPPNSDAALLCVPGVTAVLRERRKLFHAIGERTEKTVARVRFENKETRDTFGEKAGRVVSEVWASPLDQFLVERDVPCTGWFDARGLTQKYKKNNNTYTCTALVPCADEKRPPPKPLVCSFGIECDSDDGCSFPDAKKEGDRVVQISAIFSNGKRYLFTLYDPEADEFTDEAPTVVRCATEPDLFDGFGEIIRTENPVVVVGFNSSRFDTEYVHERIERFHPSRNGFYRQSAYHDHPCFVQESRKRDSFAGTILVVPGRLYVDQASWIIKQGHKLDSYSLSSCVRYFNVPVGERDLSVTSAFRCLRIAKMLKSDEGRGHAKSAKRRKKMARHADGASCERIARDNASEYTACGRVAMALVGDRCIRHSSAVMDIFDKTLTFTDLMMYAKVTSCQPKDIVNKGQMALTDAMFYRASNRAGFVVNDKCAAIRKYETGITFEGGYVFAVPGLYKSVVILDFKSLYPSLMIGYNLCPTTATNGASGASDVRCIDGGFAFSTRHEGLTATMCRSLIGQRTRVKKLIAAGGLGDTELIVMGSLEKAYKRMSNAIYGVSGMKFELARYTSRECGAAITSKARESLRAAVSMVSEWHGDAVKIVYGDTDSIVICVPAEAAEDPSGFGRDTATRVSKAFPPPMELCFENHFTKFFVILKKKYAMVSNGEIETKGLKTNRRDNCVWVQDTLTAVLETILRNEDEDEAAIANDVAEYLKGRVDGLAAVDVESQLVVTMTIKNFSEDVYDDVGTLIMCGDYIAKGMPPTVRLARRISKRRFYEEIGTRLRYVHVVPYSPPSSKEQTLGIESYAFYAANANFIKIDYENYVRKLKQPIKQVLDEMGIVFDFKSLFSKAREVRTRKRANVIRV